MSLEDITLTTNKTITRVSNNRRTIRQGEAGLVLPVELVGADDKAVDLSDIVLEFNERKDGGKVVYDSDQSRFNKVDAANGKFEYTLQSDVYAASGTCWFILKKGSTVIDTTKDFYFDVLPDSSIHLDNDNYVSNLNAQIDAFTAQVQKTKEDTNNLIAELKQTNTNQINDANNKITAAVKKCTDALDNATNQLNSYQSRYEALETSLNTKLKSISDNATAQTNQINQNWSNQSKQIDTDYKKQMSDAITEITKNRNNAINAVNSARDAAIKAATTNFTDKLSDIQNDYNQWKTKTTTDWNNQVKNLQNTLNTVNGNVDATNKKMQSIMDAVTQAHADFAKIDFSSYRLKSDSYSKDEINELLKSAGKLKTVSINGNTPVPPDANGNVNLAVPNPDLSPYATKKEVSQKVDSSTVENLQKSVSNNGTNISNMQKTVSTNSSDIASLKQNKADKSSLTSLTNTVNAKADASTVLSLNSKVSAVETTANSANTTAQQALNKVNSLTPFTIITQAQYDKLTDAQKQSDTYGISG